MRSPVQVWSAAPLKNTTKTSCFFNAFLTHLRDFFLNRAWSLSSALDAFSCKQSLIFACRLNYPAKLHAATACRFLCAFRTPLQKLCRRVRRLRSRLPLASNFSLFTCRQQLIKYRLFTTKTSCFFNAFLTHLRDLFLNRAWSLSSALGD